MTDSLDCDPEAGEDDDSEATEAGPRASGGWQAKFLPEGQGAERRGTARALSSQAEQQDQKH